jgi:predicted phosphodiesterase
VKQLPSCDALILAGDVATPKTINRLIDFLQAITSDYDKIFYVLGNHEYYQAGTSIALYREVVSQVPNVVLLENEQVDWSGLTIFGTTMWSDIQPGAYYSMNDCNFLSLEEYRKRHQQAKEAIMALAPASIDVMITHHMPSHALTHERYRKYGTSMQSAFSTDMSGAFDRVKQFWCFGHTHAPCDNVLEGVRFLCNPIGYPGENPSWEDKVIVLGSNE